MAPLAKDALDCSSDNDPKWYVIYTKRGQEFRALENLENQGYQCYLPTLATKRLRQGILQQYREPMFSRYLFIQLRNKGQNWGPIRSTRGVCELVKFGEYLATVPEALINGLQRTADGKAIPPFTSGECVSITSGPFSGLEGIFKMADGEARAIVLIELLNKPQKITLSLDILRSVA